MTEPNQNDTTANEQQNSVFDKAQEAAAETVENVAAPEATVAGSVPMQDAQPNAYGQPVNQIPNPNAQYGYAAPTPVQGTPAPKEKTVAGILGILLGGLGVHKFYLGYTVPGVIMLLISVLTLGMLAVVPAVIGIIEGIMYLTMDDTQFYNTYVAGKKEWF